MQSCFFSGLLRTFAWSFGGDDVVCKLFLQEPWRYRFIDVLDHLGFPGNSRMVPSFLCSMVQSQSVQSVRYPRRTQHVTSVTNVDVTTIVGWLQVLFATCSCGSHSGMALNVYVNIIFYRFLIMRPFDGECIKCNLMCLSPTETDKALNLMCLERNIP